MVSTVRVTAAASAPIWVPILVGVLGLIGVIVTQCLAGRRANAKRLASDAREERQLVASIAREDKQQQFVQQTNEAALQRSEAQRQYEQRQEAYSRLALALARWWDLLGTARAGRVAVQRMPSGDEKDALRGARVAAEEAWSTVELIGSPPVRAAYRSTWATTSFLSLTMGQPSKGVEEIERAFDRAHVQYMSLLDMLRIDLGVAPEDSNNLDRYRQRMEAGKHEPRGDS